MASKAQVRQMVRDIEQSYRTKRAEERNKAFESERVLAQKFADEINRRAAQYGYAANARPVASQGGGWLRGWTVQSTLQ